MKIVHINTVPNGSTGTIMMNIHKALLKEGYDSYVVWGRGRKAENKYEIYMNDKLGVYFHAIYARLTGKVGFASKRATKKLLKKLDEIEPDIIHLHNIHGYYINIEILFNYIKQKNINVVWTLHDCWAFTGHCTHFQYYECDKWKIKCNQCPAKKEYPKSFVDNSICCYEKKKQLFTGLNNVTIVTPSVWLENLVNESYLNYARIKIIPNGIDEKVFRIKESSEIHFRKSNNLEDKIIVLGVASEWTEKKGVKDFIKLSYMLDNRFQIVLVGVKKKQMKKIPKKILCIERTNNVDELVDIYNQADIFVNPTYEDNYPTVNIEAMCCGLNFIAYDTGGCKEQSQLTKGNIITDKDVKNIYQILSEIEYRKTTKDNNNSNIVFSKNFMINNYLRIYKGEINENKERYK